MERKGLVCLNLSQARNKGRSWLRDPSEDYCSLGPYKYYIFFLHEGHKILLWGRKWPAGRKLETPGLKQKDPVIQGMVLLWNL